MKNVLITGSSGMVGRLVLDLCLGNPAIDNVTIITRRASGITHPKLTEIIHTDFLDYSAISTSLQNQHICFYCIGVYTGQVSREEATKITVDYTKAFAEALRITSRETVFCFLSGQGADPSGKSSMAFASDKGRAENILANLKFKATYIFRPGYIYPVTPRKEPNFSYRLMRALYKPLLRKIYPNIGLSSEDLAKAMVHTGLQGAEKTVLENRDIRKLAASGI